MKSKLSITKKGQALIECCISLIVILIILSGIILLSDICRAKIRVIARSRYLAMKHSLEVTSRACHPSTEYIGNYNNFENYVLAPARTPIDMMYYDNIRHNPILQFVHGKYSYLPSALHWQTHSEDVETEVYLRDWIGKSKIKIEETTYIPELGNR
jgi:hypothetical protein